MPRSSHGVLDPGAEFGKVNMKHMKREKKNTGNSDKTNQRERKKKMACWNGCSMFVLLFLYHVISKEQCQLVSGFSHGPSCCHIRLCQVESSFLRCHTLG